ncbi:MAG TPA: hypothetical protein PLF54_04080 [Deltaproteobacteria bacterium]|nr:hypothetical protein [Deltaproteobacteria bacterium]
MAVVDSEDRLNLEKLSEREKYGILTKTLYIRGHPELSGPTGLRLADSLMLRAFGLLLSLGNKEAGEQEEYRRLTGNFRRIGLIAKKLAILGPLSRLIVRAAMQSFASLFGRQRLFGLDNGKTGVRDAAARYFTAADLFGFKIEVENVDDDCVQFRITECPIGYTSGDDVKLCMATNKWDRQCVRMMGARLLLEAVIPEGAPACRAYIVPAEEKVPGLWRRYQRFTV